MRLFGAEIEYNTSICYKGNNGEIINSTSLHYSIINKKGGTYGGTFNLTKSNEFRSKSMVCGGCNYFDKEKEVTCIIFKDYDEELILKRDNLNY